MFVVWLANRWSPLAKSSWITQAFVAQLYDACNEISSAIHSQHPFVLPLLALSSYFSSFSMTMSSIECSGQTLWPWPTRATMNTWVSVWDAADGSLFASRIISPSHHWTELLRLSQRVSVRSVRDSPPFADVKRCTHSPPIYMCWRTQHSAHINAPNAWRQIEIESYMSQRVFRRSILNSFGVRETFSSNSRSPQFSKSFLRICSTLRWRRVQIDDVKCLIRGTRRNHDRNV